MKKFTVTLTRTTVETATVTVDAVHRNSAGFEAAKMEPVWRPVSQATKVAGVEAAA